MASTISAGDTAWMLTSTALVLFMTVPGLALFYGGSVRHKNVVTTVMQAFTITCLITFLWLCFGYSLALAPAPAPSPPVNTTFVPSHPVYGDFSRGWFSGLTFDSVHQLATTIPESVYCMYQLTFAIITAALICGSFADRMKFWPMVVFMAFWHVFVYCPIAHSIWHPEGFLFVAGALDFAGGNVVHIASGVSGLVAAIMLGHRKGYGKEVFEPHNILLTAVGAAMLWVGWFGFNAGSAVQATPRAGMAMLVTQVAASVSGLSWMATESIVKKKPTLGGLVSGIVAGLVAITPASGYVNGTGAFVIGLLAGPFCYGGSQLKHSLGYDDALDAFGVHAVGGVLGGLLTGFFATTTITGTPTNGVFYAKDSTGWTQLKLQVFAILFSVGWAGIGSFILLKLIDVSIGLRVSEAQEEAGLDSSLHGETLSIMKEGSVPSDSETLKAMLAEGKLEKEGSAPPMHIELAVNKASGI